jgi:hypothetical protein
MGRAERRAEAEARRREQEQQQVEADLAQWSAIDQKLRYF